ncbi:hypothetical protein ES703_45272 [subsurface metagenome]
MNKTKIEWVKNPDKTQGYSLNPVKGKCPMACPYCYARAMYDRFRWNPEPCLEEDVLNNELRVLYGAKEPLGIFMCSTFEWLWNERWAWRILQFCAKHHRHRFYLLTKQPQKLPQFSPFPDNCWVGVTAVNPSMLRNAIFHLSKIEASVKYVSMEPLLEDMRGYDKNEPEVSEVAYDLSLNIINWLIIGAQTRPTVYPRIEWVEEIVRAADKANIPVFLKNNLYPLLGLANGKSICHNNEVGTLRQEMP